MTDDRKMVQVAPWPTELEDLVQRARCWEGDTFALVDDVWDEGLASGPRLIITLNSRNAYHLDRLRPTSFLFPVPAATFDRAAWQRWIWDRRMDCHHHETGEALAFVYERPNETGEMVTVTEHPFAPFHGPGRDPNRNIETGVDPMEVRVRQDGGRYLGWWWDGQTVHDDKAHDAHCTGPCTPVQLMDAPTGEVNQ
jgi:hypothetical protein